MDIQDRADEERSHRSEPTGKAVPRSGMRGTRKLPGGERSLYEGREMKRIGNLFEQVIEVIKIKTEEMT